MSLRSGGALASEFRAAGLPPEELSLTASVLGAFRMAASVPRLRARREDVIHGWMYHGNLAATIAGWRRKPVAWNIRETVYELGDEKPSTARAIRLSAHLSSSVDCIVYNSTVSREQHRQLGFSPRADMVIPNGVDISRFSRDPARRAEWRRKLGFEESDIVVARFGRAHPMKDHSTFLRAFRSVLDRDSSVKGLVVGKGCDDVAGKVMEEVRALRLTEQVRVFGDRRDVADLLQTCDVACSSSAWGEAYPNVVAEAMAAGCAVVTTDVGDSATIVGDGGTVVPARSVAALAQAVFDLVSAPDRRVAAAEAARKRAAAHLTLRASVSQYNSLYHDLASGR